MVSGKRFFSFDAQDYFRADKNMDACVQSGTDKAAPEPKLAIDNIIKRTKIQNRPYLYIGIYYKHIPTLPPVRSLQVRAYINQEYGEKMRGLIDDKIQISGAGQIAKMSIDRIVDKLDRWFDEYQDQAD